MTNRSSAQSGAAAGAWTNFAVGYLFVLAFTFVFQSLPPVLSSIMAEMNLGHTRAGLLMSVFALPGILLTIPGGYLADRRGFRTVGLLSLVLMAAGTAMTAASASFIGLGAGRIIAGTGALVLIVVAAGLISNSFSGRSLGVAMGLYGTALPLGTIIGFSLFGFLGEAYGWRGAVFAPMLIIIVAAGATALIREPGPAIGPDSLGSAARLTIGRVWPVGLAWLWFNAAVIGFLTFAPQVLTELGYSLAAANFIAALIMLGALVVSPIIGPFAVGVRRKAGFIAISGLIVAGLFAGAPSLLAWLVPLIILLGLAAALAPAPLFALPADLVGPEHQGIAFGVISTCLNIGILIGPLSIGVVRDLTGAFTSGFYMMAAFSLFAALSVFPLIRAHKRAKNGPLPAP